MFAVVAANVGKLDWVSGCVDVNRDGWGRKCMLPAVDQALDCWIRRSWGTELKKPTKSSLTAWRSTDTGVC